MSITATWNNFQRGCFVEGGCGAATIGAKVRFKTETLNGASTGMLPRSLRPCCEVSVSIRTMWESGFVQVSKDGLPLAHAIKGLDLRHAPAHFKRTKHGDGEWTHGLFAEAWAGALLNMDVRVALSQRILVLRRCVRSQEDRDLLITLLHLGTRSEVDVERAIDTVLSFDPER